MVIHDDWLDSLFGASYSRTKRRALSEQNQLPGGFSQVVSTRIMPTREIVAG